MTELKTLKDLRYDKRIEERKTPFWIIDEWELKAEAVKRAKYYLNKNQVSIGKISRDQNGKNLQVTWIKKDINAEYYAGLLFEIIDFNNLTEEDLK